MQAPFAFEPKTQVHYGPGLAGDAEALLGLAGVDIDRVVVISDAGVIGAGLAKDLIGSLEARGVKVTVFDSVKSDPTAASVDEAAGIIRDTDPQMVIGLGGGSPMDVAKLAAVVAQGDEPTSAYVCRAENNPQPQRVMVMIPTTSGTGAEVTRSVIFTEATGSKVWAWGPEMLPQLAILDPELTVGLPPHLTAATAMDALVHAIEAVGHQSTTPLATAFGHQAISLVCGAAEKAMAEPGNLAARGDLIVGSCLAGLAINEAGCGLAHGMGHALGSMSGIHHGRAVSLVLNAAMAWNAEGSPEVYAAIARSMGLADNGRSQAEMAAASAVEFERLLTTTGVEISVAGDGIGPDDVDELVRRSLAEECKGICDANCRIPDTDDLKTVAARVLAV